jgi:pimeloyl-ACP methyl ester carboxylesterase
MEQITTRVTTADGVAIHVFDLRSGGEQNLLMLHGVGRAGRTFSSFATMLPNRFRVQALDFRGHGKSERAGDRYRIVDYVKDAIATIEAIGRPVVLYGHSLGALVATATAGHRPHLVSAVVLEDPPSPNYWHQLQTTNYYPTFQAMNRWAGRPGASVADIACGFGDEVLKTFSDGRVLRIRDVRDQVSVRFTARCLVDLDPAVMANILNGRWPEQFELEQLFRAIQCPVLVMRGDVTKGGMLPEPDAVALMELLQDGLRLDFPNAGHLLHWQVRSEAAMQVSAFLESL